jgi:threonine dehydrogenase-like Zn-dependent dehydrogenase
MRAVLGHEFMGEVVEVGKDNQRLKVGDRVVVPFTIALRPLRTTRKNSSSWARMVIDNFVAAIAKHRHFARETDPPRV